MKPKSAVTATDVVTAEECDIARERVTPAAAADVALTARHVAGAKAAWRSYQRDLARYLHLMIISIIFFKRDPS